MENEIKNEVIAAYNNVLRKLKRKDPIEEKKIEDAAIEEKRIIDFASKETSDELVKNLGDLKLFISKSIDEIKSKLLPYYEKFYTLRYAVEFSDRQLQERYNIEVAADTLASLLTAQREERVTFEKEMTEQRRNFEMERAQYERERQQEESEYNFKRDSARKMDQEQYEAAKFEFEQQMLTKRKTAEEEFELREARLAARENEHQQLREREAHITAREKEYQQLKEKSARYPEELRNAVQRAEEAVFEKLTRKYEYDAKLTHIELESERKLYQQKITALEEQIEKYKSLKKLYSQINFDRVEEKETV